MKEKSGDEEVAVQLSRQGLDDYVLKRKGYQSLPRARGGKTPSFLAWLGRAVSVSSLNRTVRRQNEALEHYPRTLEAERS